MMENITRGENRVCVDECISLLQYKAETSQKGSIVSPNGQW